MILVTGATGFIGGRLCRALRARGEAVRALVRDPARADELRALGVEVVQADLARPLDRSAGWAGRLEGTRVVFHLAGQIRPTAEGTAAYRRHNVEATANLLAACRTLPLAAFVHVSSVGAMGRLAELPASEATPCAPDNGYGRSKHEAEGLVRRAGEEGLPVVVLRPAWVYGPGDLRTRPLFAAIQRGRFVQVGDGRTWLHPVYVDDVVQALLAAADQPKAAGQTYLVAGPDPVRLGDLAALIAELAGGRRPRLAVPFPAAWLAAATLEAGFRLLGRRPPVYRRQLEFFWKAQLFDTRKARDELGFVAATGLRAGLRHAIAWYRDHGLLA